MRRLTFLFLAGLFAATAFLPSCSKAPSASPTNGQSVNSIQLSGAVGFVNAYAGDTQYAVVSSEWMRSFYDEFRSEIFRKGVTKWDERFDCNHFAGYYVSLAQTRFYLENFHSDTRAQTLAVGVFWYKPAWAKGQGHAIVCAMTEKGLLFLEPQTGQFVVLTPAEQSSAYLKVF